MIKPVMGCLFVVMTLMYSLGYWRGTLGLSLLSGLVLVWAGFAIGLAWGWYKYPEMFK